MPSSYSDRNSGVALLIAAVFACSWTASARAQSSNAALAESLFREGKRLSIEHKFAEACPKFAESYKLDPGLGTLLNLATCHESEGKPASAWAEFSEAMARAKREGDAERAQLAEEHIHALEPKLAHVTINLVPGAAVPGLSIKFDSRELSTASLGLQIAVDPGRHLVEAIAPGKLNYAQSFDTPAQPTTVAIAIPVLQDAASAASAPPATGTPTPASAAVPSVAPLAAPPAAPPAAQSGNSHTGAIVSGAATGLFAVGVAVTAVLYSSKRSAFNSANASNDPSRNDKRDSAQTLGTVNLVCTGGALVSAGILVYFLATSGSRESPSGASARLRILPAVSPTSAGLILGGTL
jgi:hypothetical protein